MAYTTGRAKAKRWRTMSDSELDAESVYTGAFGWQYNNAIAHIWAHTEAGFIRAIHKAMYMEARQFWQNDDDSLRRTLTSYMDELWYVGPFLQTVAELIANMEEPDRADELRDDIRMSASGYIY